MGSPVLIGFLTGLSVLGGIVVTVATFALRRYLELAKAHTKLKDDAVKLLVKEAEKELKVAMATLAGDFRTLRAEVNGTLKAMDKTASEQTQKYERTTVLMKQLFERGEVRFTAFQRRLEDVHVMVERLKKATGIK